MMQRAGPALANALGVGLDLSCACDRCTARMCSRRNAKTESGGLPCSEWPGSRYRRQPTNRQSLSAYEPPTACRFCSPIAETGAVAAVHAGWKGTAAGAAMVAVRSLTSRYGARAGRSDRRRRSEHRPVLLRGGSRVSPVIFHRTPHASAWFTHDAKPHLDLWRATRDQLARAGVPPTQIHVCALCTFDHPALFHSYRRDGTNAGRLVAAIRSAPGRTP